MKKILKRAAVAVAAAGTIGAGTLAAVPQAHAAGPGDLQIIGGVNCTFKRWGPNWTDGPIWQMHRFMGVRNVGGSTMTGVTVSEFGGPTRWVKADKAKGTKLGELRPGQTAILVIINKGPNPHQLTIDGMAKTGTIPVGQKVLLSLGNVENKSSATIRGEITSTNVTDALTFAG